jgi:hypothetical protein
VPHAKLSRKIFFLGNWQNTPGSHDFIVMNDYGTIMQGAVFIEY